MSPHDPAAWVESTRSLQPTVVSSWSSAATELDGELGLHDTDEVLAFASRGDPALPKWSPGDAGPGLWDTEDERFLDKVRCHIEIQITEIDAKDGSFALRFYFLWWLRTLNTQERTNLRHRVPGVRMPRLTSTVLESRVWREEALDSTCSYCWRGTSVIAASGCEIFEMYDFPFDRQAIHTGLMEFVWRSHKDTDAFDETMKVVSLTTETSSFLPEWQPWHSCIEVLDERDQLPSFATRFKLLLRVERQHSCYSVSLQVFLVSTIVTVASCLPLVTTRDTNVANRIGLASAGLLALILFKQGVQDHYPAVPYLTYTTKFLLSQIITLTVLALYDILAYKVELKVKRLVRDEQVRLRFEFVMDVFEDVLMVLVASFWIGAFLYTFTCKGPKPWKEVLANQDAIYGEVPEGPHTLAH